MARPPPSQASTPCELCHLPAHVLCYSDDAFLCWRCDSMVHGANFLVARHQRTYLCSCCAGPTTMAASGAFLPSRSQLCARCSTISTEDYCTTGSGSSGSDCSVLTSESDADSVPSLGSCERESIMSCYATSWKRSLELQLPTGNHDSIQDSSIPDSMSGVEDEPSSSREYGTSGSSSSYIRNDAQRGSGSQGRPRRSFRRSSKA